MYNVPVFLEYRFYFTQQPVVLSPSSVLYLNNLWRDGKQRNKPHVCISDTVHPDSLE